MIKFSIIIPCYNSGQFIDSCIGGILNQTLQRSQFEVIFVDDCSTDDTIEKINYYLGNTDVHFRILQNTTNSGPGKSRRKAAESAKGEYLCFCDSDDSFDKNLLSDLDVEIQKNNSELVFYDMSYILGDKMIRKRYTKSYVYGDKISYLSSCAESLCNLTVKRSIFLDIKTIDIRNGEDLALVPLLIVTAKRISHIDKSYYFYVMRNDSASLSKPSKTAYANMISAFEHIRNNLTTSDNEINKSIEFIGVKTVLYNSTIMGIKGENQNRLLSKIVNNFSEDYPNWYINNNIKSLSAAKRIYLWAIKNRIWIVCRLYSKIHSYILKR